MRACGPDRAGRGLARAGRGPMRAEPARAYRLTILARPAFFLRAGPAGQALIVIPRNNIMVIIIIVIFMY